MHKGSTVGHTQIQHIAQRQKDTINNRHDGEVATLLKN